MEIVNFAETEPSCLAEVSAVKVEGEVAASVQSLKLFADLNSKELLERIFLERAAEGDGVGADEDVDVGVGDDEVVVLTPVFESALKETDLGGEPLIKVGIPIEVWLGAK